ncbi:MAG: 50S ribosome-binding GTPase [Planctomycetota bacterium]|nr:50S ribosome-binding GTPase [Planctomycetota bacterium]MDP6761554.1 50S ribosome-binding GTPase [Planctomycetota bacterium]MDP6990646.1 50S ribosome-binding GTPase [Planctomycetota bacterium]
MSVRVEELTPPGTGAVSVLEVRGEGAFTAVAALAGRLPSGTGAVGLVRLGAGEETLDEALVVVHAHDHLELCLHANPSLVRAVTEALGGAAGADPQRRSPRERAERLLADAPCEAAARIVLDQLDGALCREVERLAALPPEQRRAGARELVARSRSARRALVPARVVLAGPVNAGKSTLFNALVGRERVLVAPEEGTTRDAVGAPALVGEWPVELFDTAGERAEHTAQQPVGEVERAGVALGRDLRRAADLVIWLAPRGERPPPAPGGERRVVVASRVDELGAVERPPGGISALCDPRAACETIARAFRSALGLQERAWRRGAAVVLDLEDLDRLECAVEGEAADLAAAFEALE